MKDILVFDNITIAYAECTILNNFSLHLAPGEAVGLVGPSGAGKSSLLRMAAGLLRPASGRVHCAACRLAYVFQEPRLLPWKNVLTNVMLPLLARGVPRKQAIDRGRTCLKDMHLDQHADKYPGTLSGGMRQRVSLARAFAIQPDLLLFDEPFTGLDPSLREELRDLTESLLARYKTTLLHVTHDTRELAQSTSRIVSLDNQRSLFP